ncbi:helix-turn-helix transcriptional regulator [Fructobacillus cardui]|uniref:helix-turn-helix transcriptional regulator n=1 Tax=Fructobacillus cardui TaxID=2893170 RepID=UPI0030C8D421
MKRAHEETNMKQRLSYLIYQFRRQRGWSQDEMSRRSGLSQRLISNLEQEKLGYSLRLDAAKKLARMMGMPLGECYFSIV